MRAPTGRAPQPGQGCAWRLLLAATCLLLPLAQPAAAFKWRSCPTLPLPVYPSVLGATSSPFVHPGHELRIILNDDQVLASGGFSRAEGGDEISIVFRSIFGDAVPLAPRAATASSKNLLVFDFPDYTEEGRPLAGPVEIKVFANDQLVAFISSTDLVALPPANDVTGLLLGDASDQVVLASLDANGDLWIPARFQGDPMIMPSCPGNFILPQPFTVAGAEIVGAEGNDSNPLPQIRGVVGYLGDVVIGGDSFYGMLYPQQIDLVHVAGTLGVSICRLNDAMDLVLRVQGQASFVRSRNSPFRSVAWQSTPVSLRILAPAACPGQGSGVGLSTTHRDSFGNVCFLEGSEFPDH
jgi:hypothetical protein